MNLKQILAAITGSARKGAAPIPLHDQIAAAEKAIRDIEIERQAAVAALASAEERRRALLVEDDAEGLRAHAQALQAAQDAVDAAPLKLAAVTDTLKGLRDRQRAETVERHKAAAAAHFAAVGEAVTALLAVNHKAHAAYEAARADLGEEPWPRGIHPAAYVGMVNDQGYEAWARHVVNELPDMRAVPVIGGVVPPAPVPAPTAKPIAAPMTAGFASRRVRADPPAPRPKTPPRAPHKRPDHVPDGHKVVTYLRAGVEIPSGGTSIVGDEMALPDMTAIALVRSGAADFGTEAAHV
ncbi:hypothetical protein [Niveispirillum sp. KHB5.9]|uniref:hypothetical protein n=1 Tax=Niveispirillum sp. KHB5.9 TaxID=3400269 RepID=UPI003A843D13